MEQSDLEYVGFWARVGAAMIDTLLILAITAPLVTSVYGPGYWSVDNSIFKKFKFTERIGGEIRADIFNTLNHANPGNPNTSVTAATFGQITGVASSARQVRFGARVTF